MIIAVGTGTAILALIGLTIGLLLALVVVALFNRVIGAAVEIDGYSADILDAGVAISRNLDGVDELARTRDLAVSVPPLAVAYLDVVKRKLG